VTDYFYAEIQQGLAEGEVVSLEMPKEEREKKVQQMVTQRRAKHGENKNGAPAVASTNTNSAPSTSSGTSSSPDTAPKTRPSINGPRTDASSGSTH
jgi:hypothetical protein